MLSAFLLVVGGGFCGSGLVVLLMAGFKKDLLLVFLSMILMAVGLLAYAVFALQ